MLFKAIEPMLLASQKDIPITLTDPALLYEAKYDGWRILIHKSGDRIEVFTRGGMNVTRAFPEFQALAPQIGAHTAILDGEGICLDKSGGRPHLERFAARAKLREPRRIATEAARCPATFMAFDILMAEDDKTEALLLERKELLADLLTPGNHLQVSPYKIGDGRSLFEWTKANQWEGIVAKQIRSRYAVGQRPTAWVKWKHRKQTECAIVGYAHRPFRLFVMEGIGSPVTMVEYGFKPEEKRAFRSVIESLHTERRGDVQWVKPGFRCRVEYLEHTDAGHLRDAVFRGFVLPQAAPSAG